MPTARLKIAKMDADDARRVEQALEAVNGVQSVRVSVAENEAVVEHAAADVDELTAAVKRAGYISFAE